jgi:hypothetical protein
MNFAQLRPLLGTKPIDVGVGVGVGVGDPQICSSTAVVVSSSRCLIKGRQAFVNIEELGERLVSRVTSIGLCQGLLVWMIRLARWLVK